MSGRNWYPSTQLDQLRDRYEMGSHPTFAAADVGVLFSEIDRLREGLRDAEDRWDPLNEPFS